MATEKTPNYTTEMETQLKDGYDPTAGQETRKTQVKALAAALGKKEQSIVGKLNKMGLYVKQVYIRKGSKRTKEQLAEDLENMFPNVADGVFESFAKANKTSLVRLISEIEGEREDYETALKETASEETASE